MCMWILVFGCVFPFVHGKPEYRCFRMLCGSKKVLRKRSLLYVLIKGLIYLGLCCLSTILAELCLYLISQHPGAIRSLAYIQSGMCTTTTLPDCFFEDTLYDILWHGYLLLAVLWFSMHSFVWFGCVL